MTIRQAYYQARAAIRLRIEDLTGQERVDRAYKYIRNHNLPQCIADALAGEFCNYR
jgi:hypothetical protein